MKKKNFRQNFQIWMASLISRCFIDPLSYPNEKLVKIVKSDNKLLDWFWLYNLFPDLNLDCIKAEVGTYSMESAVTITTKASSMF